MAPRGKMSRDYLYENIIRPVLFNFDPEDAHDFVHSLLRSCPAMFPAGPWKYDSSDLQIEFAGTTLPNPIGLAAGFDKNGSLVPVLDRLGFGFAEIGSICARPHGGNPKPRLFRLPDDKALINRLGLNGLGAEVVSKTLTGHSAKLPIGLNIAKTNDPSITGQDAVDDILYSFNKLRELPVAYFTINASCPNTKEGCVKEADFLSSVFQEIQKQNLHKRPVLVKLSPDSSTDFIEEVVSVAHGCSLAGFVCGNTSTSRNGLSTNRDRLSEIGNGGLSGVPLLKLNLDLCKRIFKLKKENQVIIGVGGISSGQDAYDYICAGASAVQLYTALVYKGPSAVRQIALELSALLKHDKKPLRQLVGSAN